MIGAKVQVRNLREITAAMKAANDGVPGRLKEYLLPVAQDVARVAAARVPRDTGAAAGTVTARATQRGAGVSFGGAKAPYFPWLDFGGSTGRGHVPRKAGSGSVKRAMPLGGRYVYPAIEDSRDRIERGAMDAVLKAALDARLGVR